MLYFFVLCSVFIEVFSNDVNECLIPGKFARQADYYWRDYMGIVPDDAIEGGYTEIGNRTYIGHFRHESQRAILVGNIYAGKRQAITAYYGTCTHNIYVLILCSGNKGRFEWKQTKIDDLHLLNDYHVVKGGIFNDTILYIGRASIDDQVKVGHIYPESHLWKGLWIYQGDTSQRNLHNFEILVYPR